jgi:hypothetical protein
MLIRVSSYTPLEFYVNLGEGFVVVKDGDKEIGRTNLHGTALSGNLPLWVMHCFIRRLVRNAHEQAAIVADCLRHTDGKRIDYKGLAKLRIFKSKYENKFVRTYSVGDTVYFVYAERTFHDFSGISFTWGNPENISFNA